MKTDLLIAGGGLAGGLTALALAARRPDLRVTLVEAGPALGGNHVWSFFDADVAAERPLVAPLVAHRWADHEVAFPGYARRLGGAYNSITSERFDAGLRATLPADRILTGAAIATLDPGGATLADGRRIDSPGVIDARGATALPGVALGWQKFVGRLLRLEAPHGLDRPTIMDATVEQIDGYRFVYLLPFDERSVFVEDTYYSDTPDIDRPALEARIAAYAETRGWRIEGVERDEAAALPIAIGGSVDRLLEGPVATIGMAAGLFQPMTGYSLPDAVRAAALIAGLPHLDSASLKAALDAHARETWAARGFYRLLGRMLFRAADPAERWRVLARFYRLDEGLIARFYAGNSTLADKARILAGRPPVPLRRALAALWENDA